MNFEWLIEMDEFLDCEKSVKNFYHTNLLYYVGQKKECKTTEKVS